MRKCLFLMLILALFPSCAEPPQSAHERLFQIFDKEWSQRLANAPELAASLGDLQARALWRDMSLETQDRYHQYNVALLQELEEIDINDLSAEDKSHHKIFEGLLKQRIERYPFGWHLIPLNQRGGIQTEDSGARDTVFQNSDDFRSWIEKLDKFPTYMDQHITLMRKGIEARMLLPKVVMKRIPAQIEAQIVDDPSTSGFYFPFLKMPADLVDGDALAKRCRQVIQEKVVPAYRTFLTFFVDEYLPACYDKVGIWQLPRGKEMYALRARHFTTTDLSPEEIHQLGLKEVARIRMEMNTIIEQVGFEGSFSEFLQHLRSDPSFYYQSSEELFHAYEALSKRIDPTLVKLFRKMPRMPYGVQPIPDSFAPDTTTAYYQSPSLDGTRAGTYYVNLYKPETRPKYEMEALTIHEAVPGHHFQIALGLELGEMPFFRRFNTTTAFVEGWALYAESLGEELGFYADPYAKFGQLTYEMWRAVRLVVDTGIHYMGWERQKAIDFFMANAAKTELDIVNEIDRYIAWPGQALAYKVGELRIKELRRRSEVALGVNFDIRAFHEILLSSGAIPLDVLEDKVMNWIASKKK